MKKILFGLMALGLLTACEEDYSKYAAPQAYGPESPVNIQITFNATNYVINMATDADKDIALFSYTTSNTEITNITANVALFNDTIQGYGKDGKLFVAANDVERLVGKLYGEHTNNIYTSDAKADIVAHTANGDGTFFEQTTSARIIPAAIPDPAATGGQFKLLVNDVEAGDFEKKADGTYQIVVTTEEPNSSILFVTTDGTTVGSYNEDDNAKTNPLALNSSAKAINIAEPGEWKIIIDIQKGTYKIEDNASFNALFMTGNELGWGATWLPLNIVNSNWDDTGETKGIFWIVRYFQANEQFKFSPNAAWDGDFGGNQMQVTDDANAGYVDDGTNCKVTNAGWYQLTVRPGAKTLVIEQPKVYLCGEIVAGGWDAAIPDEVNRFTTPTAADGEFVSPAFTNNGNVRMFTLIKDVPWWRTEYNIFGTDIVIRTEGDQEGVWQEAGKRAYLNFTTMKGRFE